MQLTYNDRNYKTIAQEEWEYIAQTVVNHFSDGTEEVKVDYEPSLRPTDAALLALEDSDVCEKEIPRFYMKRTWQDWRKELGI